MKRISALLLLGVVPPLLCAERANALDIPVSVQELLPTNVPSRARATQVVRVGVPMPAGEHIQSLDELGFAGSPAAQFRVLHRDPETQDIRWVLARFLGQPGNNVYSLTRGSGTFGGADLATDQDSILVVDTGAARFTIRRQGFRFLDSVVRGATPYVTQGGRGIVVTSDGTLYTSALDATATIELEENGPLETVVRARGRLTSVAGTQHLWYSARLYFTRDAATCRASVTLENGRLGSLSGKEFDAAWVELPLALDDARGISFGTSNGTVSDSLGAGSTAHLLQGDNKFMRDGRTVRILEYLTPVEGLEIEVDGTTHASLGDTDDHAHGWMRLTDATRSVGVGMRDFAPQFPGGLVVEGDVARVEMFSSHNPQDDLLFSWAAHETREMLFAFGDLTDPVDFHYALQYPLLGRCSFEHYRDTGAIFGATELVSIQEEKDFFADQGKSWDLQDLAESEIEFTRQYSFRTTGGGNQFDQDLASLLDWVRAGYTGYFSQARLGVVWKADGSVPHSDDFDYGDYQLGVNEVDPYQPDGFHAKGAGSWFDDEHPHWVCMPLYYWMTGDERIREAMADYIEYRRYRGNHPYYGAVQGGAIGHMRLWSRSFRDMALGYEIVQRPEYLQDLRRMAHTLLDTIETGNSRGRNLERGYFFFGNEEDPNRRIHLFFLTEMNPIGVREGMRVLPSGDPLREELRDYLAGLAWFTLREAQISEGAAGYPYGYYAAHTNTELGNRGDQTGIVLSHGYLQSGDPRFAARARSFAWRVLVDANERRESDLSTHIRISAWNDRDQHGAILLEPESTPNPDGSWTLSWTAPDEATEYIVKYGDRRLVENLDFDQVTRTYRISPDTCMNFWAATNLQGEPVPGPGGAPETWTTPVLPAGDWRFGVKALLRSPSALAPQTTLDSGDTLEDEPVTLQVLANDLDPDGNLDPTSVVIETPPANGVASVQPGGAILYTPNPDYFGDDYLSYSVADINGQRSGPTTVHVAIESVNDPPVAVDDYYSADADETITLPILANDIDVDSPNLQVLTLLATGLEGGLELDPDGRTVSYTAPSALSGPEMFRYIVEDGHGGIDSASVYVEMTTVAVEVSDLQAKNTNGGVLVTARFETDEDVRAVRALRSRNGGPFADIPGVEDAPARMRVEFLDPGEGLESGDLLVYRFQALMATGEHRLMGPHVQVVYTPPGPRSYSLEQNRPNPFNPMTVITFSLPRAAHTTLCIYDVAGRQVNILVNEELAPGVYSVNWDGVDRRGRRVASGTYFYRLLSGRYARTKSMRLVK